MIKKIIYPLVAIILLSSCAGKFSMQKRKYNKGFYFASAKGNKTKGSENSQVVAKPSVVKSKQITSLPIESPVNSDLVISPEKISVNEPIKVYSSVKPVQPKTNNPSITSTDSKPVIAQHEYKSLKSSEFNTAKAAKKGGGGTNIVVLVILCFFWWLNLLAVFLHDGKSITLNFWITLLLDFTIIGGLIFSLLVVLDIVNLA